MRVITSAMVFCLAIGGLASCQQQSDPEVRSAIVALANSQANRPAGSSDASAETLKPQLDAIRESIRQLGETVAADSRRSKSDLTTEIGGLSAKLQEIERRLTSNESSVTTIREATAGTKTDAANALTQLASLKLSVDDLATKVKGSDPAEYLKLVREISDKEREVAAAEAARDRALETAKGTEAVVTGLRADIETLKAEMAQLEGNDISRHPQMVELRKKLQEKEDQAKEAKKEYDQLKVLFDDMRAKGVSPTTVEKTGTTASTERFASGFEATVGSATFTPQDQKYVIIAKVKTGDAPTIGETLSIVNEKDEVVCQFKVMQLYEDNSFGGIRTDNAISPVPTRGDRVLRPRATTASGR